MLVVILPFAFLAALVEWQQQIRIGASLLVIALGLFLLIKPSHPIGGRPHSCWSAVIRVEANPSRGSLRDRGRSPRWPATARRVCPLRSSSNAKFSGGASIASFGDAWKVGSGLIVIGILPLAEAAACFCFTGPFEQLSLLQTDVTRADLSSHIVLVWNDARPTLLRRAWQARSAVHLAQRLALPPYIDEYFAPHLRLHQLPRPHASSIRDARRRQRILPACWFQSSLVAVPRAIRANRHHVL